VNAPGGPLRIGLISAYDLSVPGGVQAQVLGSAHHLRALGHTVGVLAPGRPMPVGEADGDVSWSTSAGRSIAVPANGSVARLALFTWHRAVAAWTAEHDVIHLHEPLAPGLPQAVLLHSRRPVVATVHARADTLALHLAAPLLRRRLRRAALLTAVSRHALTTIRDHLGLDAVVIGNGVDVPAARPPRTAEPGATPVVVAVGRLSEPRKGIDVLLAAWPAIRARHPQARLVLAGPGRPRGMTGATAPAGVELLGWVDDQRRTALLDAADVVVAPHRGGESFGLVVAEAMARGSCVVAAALPAFADLLQPTPTEPRAGITFATGDAAALAIAVGAALADDDQRHRLGAAAWQRVKQFAWPRLATQWEQAYRRTLDRADAAGRSGLLP